LINNGDLTESKVTMKKIAIRADADEVRGMGHLMRCIAIAECIGELGNECLFFIKENQKAIAILKKNGMNYKILQNAVHGKESELDELKAELKEEGIGTLLIDAYDVTEKYFQTLHQSVRLIYIDDLNQFKYDVDGIVNYAWSTSKDQYDKYNYSNVDFLMGKQYIPVRKTFLNRRQEQIPPILKNVLITTGGTDPHHIVTGFIAQWDFEKYKNINLQVIIGQFYDNKEELRTLAAENPQIKVYENLTDLAEIMSKCEAAVSAGGTTIWELSTVGVPVVGIAFVENQKGIFPLEDAGLLAKAVDFLQDDEDALKLIIRSVERLIEDDVYRFKLAGYAKNQIDGLGAMRIAQYIVSYR